MKRSKGRAAFAALFSITILTVAGCAVSNDSDRAASSQRKPVLERLAKAAPSSTTSLEASSKEAKESVSYVARFETKEEADAHASNLKQNGASVEFLDQEKRIQKVD